MKLPIGYFDFHKNDFINYQLNRCYTLGYSRKKDIEKAGREIHSFKDFIQVFTNLAEESISEQRLQNAAFYLRAAEFLIEPSSKDKIPVYNKFLETFDAAFSGRFERHKVPYQSEYLSTIKIKSQTDVTKGTILAFGGSDSFIEEFFPMWEFFARNGYEVLAFEGPGQGASLRTYNLTFDHDWEKPTGAVLDYFNIEDATLLGVSMGGYWCIRAGAFEKRISKIISFPPVFDWMELTNPFIKKLVSQLLKWRRLMNFLIRLKMNAGILRHAINQTLFMIRKDEPIDAVKWMLGMNKHHLHSELVDQDVLLLGGENDKFQPTTLLYKQEKALVNAKSVTKHIFRKEEHADQHCQIGNVGLALEVMLQWLDKKHSEKLN